MTAPLPTLAEEHALNPTEWTYFAPLYAYWQSKHHGKELPKRKDLDPLDIPDLLPELALIDVVSFNDGPPRLRFRLMGTQIALHLGKDHTGDWLDDLQSNQKTDLDMASHDKAAKDQQVGFAKGRIQAVGHKPTGFTCMLLPLSEDGQQANMLVALYHFTALETLPPH